MRFVILTHTFFPLVGGAEIGIHELCKRISAEHEVIVLTPIADDNQKLFVFEEVQGRPTYEVRRYRRWADKIRHPRLQRLASLVCLQEFWLLWRINRERKIDGLNVHFMDPFGMTILFARFLLRINSVITLAGRSDVVNGLSLLMQFHAGIVLRSANQVTQNTGIYLAGTRYSHLGKIVPYGADLHAYTRQAKSNELRLRLGVGEDQFMLLAVQRLSAVKRVDLLMKVAKKLKELGKPAVLVVIGKGGEYARLTAKALREEIDNVRLLGYIAEKELPSYFASADVFVSHSMFETFGVTFAQAMASGIPIVAADTSSISLVVQDKVNGFVVPPNDLAAFVEAIVKLTEDRTLRNEISLTNRKKAQSEYDWDIIASNMKNILSGSRK